MVGVIMCHPYRMPVISLLFSFYFTLPLFSLMWSDPAQLILMFSCGGVCVCVCFYGRVWECVCVSMDRYGIVCVCVFVFLWRGKRLCLCVCILWNEYECVCVCVFLFACMYITH